MTSKKKFFFTALAGWWVLVNLPMWVPSLNVIEPYVFGLPVIYAWLWGWNIVMTIIFVWASFGIFEDIPTPKGKVD